jgi:Predicted metal binding domain
VAKDKELAVTVVVAGGAPVKVMVKENQKVEHLIKEALSEAGIKHPNLPEWKLRFAEGGQPLDPEEKVQKAGIAEGQTLFLDPEEGGGGQVAVALPPEPPEPPLLVERSVSAAKLDRQLADWETNRERHEARGVLLLGRGELHVDVGFCARLPLGLANDLVAMPLVVRFDFRNYDLWAPSVRLVDPIDRRWLIDARLGAIDFENTAPDGTPMNLFVGHHPETARVFLCKRGVREYHSHPEHSGDDWLLHRDGGHGRLGGLSDLLWRLTVDTVIGIGSNTDLLGSGAAVQVNHRSELRQGKIQQVPAGQAGLVPGQIPPEVQAQLAQMLAQGGK